MAISSPLLETSINGARGVLINVTGSMDIGLEEVETAANLVQEAADPNALIIFGATFDENMEDEICVTVIATGFDETVMTATSTPAAEKSARNSRVSTSPFSSAHSCVTPRTLSGALPHSWEARTATRPAPEATATLLLGSPALKPSMTPSASSSAMREGAATVRRMSLSGSTPAAASQSRSR